MSTAQLPQLQATITQLMAAPDGVTTTAGGTTNGGSSGGGTGIVPADEDDGSPLCSVCMEAPPSILLAPCGHIELCHKCCESIRAADNLVSRARWSSHYAPNNGRSVPSYLFLSKQLPNTEGLLYFACM